MLSRVNLLVLGNRRVDAATGVRILFCKHSVEITVSFQVMPSIRERAASIAGSDKLVPFHTDNSNSICGSPSFSSDNLQIKSKTIFAAL
jgi:hypothetical protein